MAPADAAVRLGQRVAQGAVGTDVTVMVVHGAPDRLYELPVTLPHGATLLDAVVASGLLAQVPTLSVQHLDLGVFNQPRPAHTPARSGDRIEVYRPLMVDPKEARRVRVAVRRRRRAG